jgi:CBS domain-containing protein
MQRTPPTVDYARIRRICVDSGTTVVAACRLMRDFQAQEMVVADRAAAPLVPVGIVSAFDIATRIVAAELDPAVLTAGDIAWNEVVDEAGAASTELRLRLNAGSRVLPVLDCEGGLAGIVFSDELLRALS